MNNFNRILPVKKCITACMYLLLIFSSALAYGLDEDTGLRESPRIGIAFGGGGARGIAHIGMIKAFEEEGIPVDIIAGTSMGSIIGGLYAAGYSGKDLERIVNEIDWNNIFSEQPDKTAEAAGSRYGIMEPLFRLRFKLWKIYLPVGMNNGQRISDTLFKYTSDASFAAGSDFDNLSFPYRAVAVNTSTGKAEALGKGELAQAIRASMAIPLVFNPAYFRGSLYIDGGVLDNLPTDVVKKMGADIIIACDVDELSPLDKEPDNIADIARHTFDIATLALKKQNVKLADVHIQPDLKGHSVFDYSDFDFLIEAGYKAAMDKMDEIKKVIGDRKAAGAPAGYTGYSADGPDGKTVEQITVSGLSRVRKPVVLKEFPLEVNGKYSTHDAIEGVKRIYATGLFENVWLELRRTDDEQVIINIHVVEKYPRTIGLGMNYTEDEGLSGFVQIVHFNLLGWGERFMPFVRYGELHKRAGLEIVNDMFLGSSLTLNNGVYYERDTPYTYDDDGNQTGNLDMDRFVVKMSAGKRPLRKLLVMGGVRGEYVRMDDNPQIGVDEYTTKNMNIFAKILLDTTDDRYFPSGGVKLSVDSEVIKDIENTESPSMKAGGTFDLYIRTGSRGVLSSTITAGASSGSLPVYEEFKTGGPYFLPGYNRNEIWSDSRLAAGMQYRIRIWNRLYLRAGISAGVIDSAESFDDVYSGIFGGLGMDTPAGPLRLDYGVSQSGRSMLYFSLGHDF